MTESKDEKAIEIRDVIKRFGRVMALDRLSFEVPSGVIAGFVGPNGSGKTTTMRILATLLKQDAGIARVFGCDTVSAGGARQVRRMIGFVPDYFGLYTDMTPSEYLDFFAAAYRIPGRQRPGLVRDMLSLLSLSDKADTLVSGLSRGMQQKLSLGRALLHSPRLLILDEPASGLDPRARIELMELLRELKRMGKTIFISSHILSELHRLCDQVVILEKGRAAYAGGVEQASEGLSPGSKVLEIAVASEPDLALEILKGLQGVKEIRCQGKSLFVGHEEALSSADLVEACVRGGVRVAEAKRVGASLEEVFMQITEKGEPQKEEA